VLLLLNIEEAASEHPSTRYAVSPERRSFYGPVFLRKTWRQVARVV